MDFATLTSILFQGLLPQDSHKRSFENQSGRRSKAERQILAKRRVHKKTLRKIAKQSRCVNRKGR